MKAHEFITEKWSQKYKSSINCSHPKGFSQRAHCAGKKKHNESMEMEMTCPDCGMCQTHGNLNEIKKGAKDSNGYTKCWPGHHAAGTKKGKNGGQVRNCVPNESQGVAEAVDIGQEWMSDTELDQYVPDRLQQQWRELLGYDMNGNPSAYWANLTGGYEPDVNDPQHRRLMVKVANKWFAAKKIPNVKFFDVKDADDELEWLVQIGEQGVAEGSEKRCMQCGMKNCKCPGDSCKCKPIAGWIPGKGFKEAIAEAAELELSKEFDLIESIIEDLALRNDVDQDVIWEDLESLTDDELYVFAVTSEPIMESEAWQKANKKDKTDGMSQKAVNTYRREHPGSKLKTAVTTKPSKLKRGSKASKRRSSYCSRSRGQMKMHSISCSKTPDKAICKARRRWNC
jgi:hypothetical protein